ncbi:MAG: membrane protein insertase YidC, partial [Silicimonas sp.]|nr:membrane protein insertase YidC [Silicimonas sp.]
MDDQNKNLILAMVLSALVLIIWTIMFPPQPVPEQTNAEGAETPQAQSVPAAPAGNSSQTAPESETAAVAVDVGEVSIETPSLDGAISLAGGRINQLALKNYNETLNGDNEVTILSPIGTTRPYYALFGWVNGGALTPEDVPDADTIWSVESGETLSPESPVTLRWNSPSGLVFKRTIKVDERFLFTVEQTVENPTETAHRLAPFGLVARHGEPQDLSGFFIIHEGAIRRTDGELEEIDYSDMPDLRDDEVWGVNASVEQAAESGWVGFTDHYWMTTLIPEQGKAFTSVVQYLPSEDVYRTAARMPTVDLAPGATSTTTTQLFAGAKDWDTIRDYEAGREITGFGAALSYFVGFGGEAKIEGFIDAIDWGWFYFLTKPIFFVLHELNILIGNMGWAIIALTIIIKALLFPLARKSYVSMAKMKELQPEMEKIKERAGDDRTKLQTEMMAMYKKEKVNP